MKLLSALFSFIIIVLPGHYLQAQEVFVPASRAQSLGGVTVCLHDSWSVLGNQAGLSTIKHPVVSGTFQNRFLIKELSTRAGFFVLPIESSIFAFSLYQFGKINFRQEKYGLSYARRITPKLHFGLQFDYYRFFLAEENQYIASYGIEAGVQYQVTSKILGGIHLSNPYKTGFKTLMGNYHYPSVIKIGAAVKISQSFDLFSEIEKRFSFPMNVKTGIEYTIMKKLYLRTGVSGKPNQLTAGMGFEVRKIKIDLAVAYNQYLGNSPSTSFQYQF